MKDYSMTSEERKDFVLGFNITEEGKIKAKYAEGGEPWPIPYNETNEQILLKKMEDQVRNSSNFERKMKKVVSTCKTISIDLLWGGMFLGSLAVLGVPLPFILLGASVCISSIIPFIISINAKIKLKDLESNKRFLEIKDELNKNVRNNNNALVNVSNKTKKIINNFPENRPIFDINSKDYISSKDMETIIENIARNERFGFDYTNEEQITRPKTKKRTR